MYQPFDLPIRPQTINRIGQRYPDGLKADCDQHDQSCTQTGQQEYPPADRCMVHKVLQPFIHEIPGDRRGDKQCQKDQNKKISAQKSNDIGNPGAQDISPHLSNNHDEPSDSAPAAISKADGQK